MSYKIFTTKYDEVVSAADLSKRYDATRSGPEGFRDRLKTQIVNFGPLPAVPPITATHPVAILADCSGSMRGRYIAATVVAMMNTGDALEAIGVPFEMLGFTTKAWKGGSSRQDWIAQKNETGKTLSNPGRLNDLRHIVLKGADEKWSDVRDNLLVLFEEGILKENIDGEAVAWAACRLESMAAPGHIVVISDGVPMDDATMAFNPATILTEHLAETLQNLTARDIPLSAVYLAPKSLARTDYPDAIKVVADSTSISKIVGELQETLVQAIHRNELALSEIAARIAEDSPAP